MDQIKFKSIFIPLLCYAPVSTVRAPDLRSSTPQLVSKDGLGLVSGAWFQYRLPLFCLPRDLVLAFIGACFSQTIQAMHLMFPPYEAA